MKYLRSIIILSLIILAGFILSVVWWNAWMYKGFIGPVDILSTAFSCDGEFCYSLKQFDMFLILCASLSVFWSMFKTISNLLHAKLELK